MIFVTVGTELPFNRLVLQVNEWAQKAGRTDVFAQIGEGAIRPSHVKWRYFLEPQEFQRCFAEAHVIIAHAGMGTILTALNAGKPILVLPRRLHLGEHRSDHQLATAQHLRDMGQIHVAFNDEELRAALDAIDELSGCEKIAPYASQELVGTVRAFIDGVAQQRTTRRGARHFFDLRTFAKGW